MLHANNRVVNVDRAELIKALKQGREKHLADFQQAKIDFEEAAVKFLTESLGRAQKGELRFHSPLAQRVLGDFLA